MPTNIAINGDENDLSVYHKNLIQNKFNLEKNLDILNNNKSVHPIQVQVYIEY